MPPMIKLPECVQPMCWQERSRSNMFGIPWKEEFADTSATTNQDKVIWVKTICWLVITPI